jgi:hypothetical protein
MRTSLRAARPLSGQKFVQFEREAPPGNSQCGSHLDTPLVGIEPLWAGQRRRGSHPCGPEIGRSSSTSAMARSPVPLCRDEDINTRQESRVVSESLPLGRIFLRPADGIPLHVIGFIEAIEDGARTAPAYTATLRAFGLGKERPMAPRILVWCWSGRGRWA